MCECAPLGTTCENEEYDLTCCAVHRLTLAITELYQSIPLISRIIPDYECPDFCIKGCGTQE